MADPLQRGGLPSARVHAGTLPMALCSPYYPLPMPIMLPAQRQPSPVAQAAPGEDGQAGAADNMDQLKAQVAAARPGTGEVAKAIGAATFGPRAAAFTALIQQVGPGVMGIPPPRSAVPGPPPLPPPRPCPAAPWEAIGRWRGLARRRPRFLSSQGLVTPSPRPDCGALAACWEPRPALGGGKVAVAQPVVGTGKAVQLAYLPGPPALTTPARPPALACSARSRRRLTRRWRSLGRCRCVVWCAVRPVFVQRAQWPPGSCGAGGRLAP